MRSDFDEWQDGFGVLCRSTETIRRVRDLLNDHRRVGLAVEPRRANELTIAADRLASAAMWLVVHMTYAERVDLTGAELGAEAFKPIPEGHTGGSLNMVPAFVGYLLANALSGVTRSWMMGQGHCVAAIEAVNVLTGDLSPSQVGRYDRTEAGLAQLVSDFYGYAIDAAGRPAAPIGSHAGPYTAGAVSEGGYLGFAEVQHVHAPLPGETLVAFLSDGAFEEQRGSDWSPRWWRAEDSGLPIPIMVLNGRRIEERSEIAQEGGAPWLEQHLRLSGFDPIVIDGHDPAAYAWAILESEARLRRFAAEGSHSYPAPMPYIIARAVKGFGFPGAGTNRAHNLPLGGVPRFDAAARAEFNAGARALFVAPDQIDLAVRTLQTHAEQERPLESGHPLAHRHPPEPVLPPGRVGVDDRLSPMDALDAWFVQFIDANPSLRPRVGNPDELKSNHMGRTLDRLRHRVNQPEAGAAEDVLGAVITALNEEAVAGAALGNKGGVNLLVSYEAFAVKMLGGLRQEIMFARRQKELGAPPGWLSVPLLATSHTWENAKNEQSHQDPTIAEALLGEMSDTARVLFPVDAASAVASLRAIYAERGRVACLVTPKRALDQLLSPDAADQLVREGAILLRGDLRTAALQFVALGAYQLREALKAHERLALRGCNSTVVVVLEPGRFRAPRDELELAFVETEAAVVRLFPPSMPRVILAHTRPEPMLGVLRRIDGGPGRTRALGFINRGGTLTVEGLLFANRCTWAHALTQAADLLGADRADWLSADEMTAVDGCGDPAVLLSPQDNEGR